MVRVMLPPELPVRDPDTRTSTTVHGITKPATPTTSLTATETARIPSGIVAGSPPPASTGANFLSRIGSFSETEVINARLAQSSILVNIPVTGALEGQEIVRSL